MAEGYDPSQYHQQAQNSEAYRLNMERLEKQEALQQPHQSKAYWKSSLYPARNTRSRSGCSGDTGDCRHLACTRYPANAN